VPRRIVDKGDRWRGGKVGLNRKRPYFSRGFS
jgi:hypothetical protein